MKQAATPYVYDLPPGLTVLDRDEQAELIGLAQSGDAAAAAKLVTGVMKLVVVTARQVATEYSLDPARFADAVHEGVLGCYVALGKYDAAFGVKFWTYAMEWVIHNVRKFATTGIVSVPRDAVRSALSCRRGTSCRRINDHTAARAIGAMDLGGADAMLELAAAGRDPHQMAADSMDRVVIQNRLFNAAACLSAADARIIRLRYFSTASDGGRLTLEEIASEMGRSREWVRLRIVRILSRMRSIIENGGITGGCRHD